MFKQINIIIGIIFLFISGIAVYEIYGSGRVLSVAEMNQKHLDVMMVGNEISSYVKRAEGHLFLYLMNGNQADKDKFYLRMKSLNEHIAEVKGKIKKEEFSALSELYTNVMKAGNRLVYLREKNSEENKSFDFDLHQKKIEYFHSVSSEIRKNGVSLVEQSSTELSKKINIVKENVERERWVIFIFIFILFVLFVYVVKQSRHLNTLTKELRRYSYIDGLTGIANRRAFDETLAKEWKRAIRDKSQIVIMMVDIDFFKQYNDRYGHAEGDECLIKVANALKACLRRPSDMIARYGGEEFIIILPDTKDAMVMAENFRITIEALAIPNQDSEITNVLTITIGVGIFSPVEELNSIEVLRMVDQALYKGKNRGRNNTTLYENKE